MESININISNILGWNELKDSYYKKKKKLYKNSLIWQSLSVKNTNFFMNGMANFKYYDKVFM